MQGARVSHNGPTSSILAYPVGWIYLTFNGWRVEGELPSDPKAVVIAAPHTSGWDLPYMLSVAFVFRMGLSWLGKHSLFGGAKGAFMRFLGGIPVDRRAKHGVVAQVVDRFNACDKMWLAIAPAGTRSRSTHWKSGFYHIAHQAQVPVVCTFLDYKRKVGGIGPSFVPTGDIRADMDRIRAFYEEITARYPDATTPIRLLDEDTEEAAPIALPTAV